MVATAQQFDDLIADPSQLRVRINYRWLLKLRWTAVVGQILTILGVITLIGIDLPHVQLAAIVGATAVTNIILSIRYRLGRNQIGKSPRLAETELLAIMAFDVFLFSGLLYLTGGADNPFAIFYLIHVVLAAIVLSPVSAWGVACECVCCFAFLFIQDVPFPELQDASRLADVLHWGVLVAFSAVALTIAWFVVHIHEELSQREQDLQEVRQKKSRLERLEALITLAAGAAHELSTPLSTIFVAAGELQHDLKQLAKTTDLGQDAVDDVDLIRVQVKRCRDILEQMSADSGEFSGEPMVVSTVGQLVDWVLERIPDRDRVVLDLEDSLRGRPAVFPRKALTRALRNLVNNALDAGGPGSRPEVVIRGEGDNIKLVVTDYGPGMSPEVSQRAFEPFFTTKAPGRGMGLGLYLSRSVVERLGGTIELVRTGPGGTVMRAIVPVAMNGAAEGRIDSPAGRSR